MIILITGIPRSGSTFLYNVMRVFCIRRNGLQHVDFGYLDERREYRSTMTYVLKTHEFIHTLQEKPWVDQCVFILHSTRNHNDSHERFVDFIEGLRDSDNKANMNNSDEKDIPKTEQYTLEDIQEMDRRWQEVCSVCVDYEDIRKNSVAVVWKTLNTLEASPSLDECESIIKEVEALPDPVLMNCLTLLYPKHKKTNFSFPTCSI